MESRLMARLARIGNNRLIDVGVTLVALISLVHIALTLPARAHTLDFSHYYVSGRLVLEGKSPYTTSLSPLYARYGFSNSEHIHTEGNPPPLLLLLTPLALLEPRCAFGVWVALEIACLAGLLALTGRDLSARGRLFLCAATLSAVPVYWHFGYSQVQLLVGVLLLVAYRRLRAGQSTAATVAITVAGLLKIYPVVLLPWFVWRSNARLKNSLIAIAVVAATLPVMGGLWSDFFHSATPMLADMVTRIQNFSIPALVARILPGQLWIGTLLGAVVIAAAYLACREGDLELEFCLLTVAMLAGLGITWGHYLVLLIFPVTVAAKRATTPGQVIALIVIVLCLNNCFSFTPWENVAANFIPLAGMIGLGVLLLRQLRR
jgi:hypothetical protein